MKIRTLIVDDEPIARRRILRLLKSDAGIEVVSECSNGHDAVAAIREQRPDLVFLDVQMPEMDGFGVVEAVGAEAMPATIFVTAFDQYAIRAFDVHALDYLLKPFSPERLHEALQRARKQIAARTPDQTQRLFALIEQWSAEQQALEQRLATSNGRYLDRLMVKSGGRFIFVRAEEIDWIEAEGNYLRLHLGKNSYLIRETMSAMEARLDPAKFLRVHRSSIVNLDQVKELRPWFAGDHIVVLRTGVELKMSRGYREKLVERMERADG